MHSSVKKTPFVSVILPVYNDTERLLRCLITLEKQDYEYDRYEIIVIDNGSAESPKDRLTQFSHVVLVEESKPGSYCARNRGLAVARGEVLAFTDSDCLAQENWISNGVAGLVREESFGVLAGRIDLTYGKKNSQRR